LEETWQKVCNARARAVIEITVGEEIYAWREVVKLRSWVRGMDDIG
jgi:hypothetical protein